VASEDESFNHLTPTKSTCDVVERGRAALGKRFRSKNVNHPDVKKMRLSTNIHHDTRRKKSACLICGKRVTQECIVCEAALHVGKRKDGSNQRKTCFQLWHSSQRLAVHNVGASSLRREEDAENSSSSS